MLSCLRLGYLPLLILCRAVSGSRIDFEFLPNQNLPDHYTLEALATLEGCAYPFRSLDFHSQTVASLISAIPNGRNHSLLLFSPLSQPSLLSPSPGCFLRFVTGDHGSKSQAGSIWGQETGNGGDAAAVCIHVHIVTNEDVAASFHLHSSFLCTLL